MRNPLEARSSEHDCNFNEFKVAILNTKTTSLSDPREVEIEANMRDDWDVSNDSEEEFMDDEDDGDEFEDDFPLNSGMDMGMESVFFRLHAKLIIYVRYVFSLGWLRFFEWLAFLNACGCLVLLVSLHLTFVSGSGNCVVEQVDKALQTDADVIVFKVEGIWSRLAEVDSDVPGALKKTRSQGLSIDIGNELVDVWLSDPVFAYSLERGFLMLNEECRNVHNIRSNSTMLTFKCVAPGFSNLLLFVMDNFVGYETAISNAIIISQVESTRSGTIRSHHGFLYNALSRDLIDLSNRSSEDGDLRIIGVVSITLFLCFVTTTLVHHTLRETQSLMLDFAKDLHRTMKNGKPLQMLVVNHVVNSFTFVPIMIGLLFFLFEFFNDQLLAFIILAIVWMCELFSVIALRSKESIRVFPRLFFLYFGGNLVYFFLFPGGFTYLAIVTAITFLQHAMLLFWNRFEIPAFENGTINKHCPREVLVDQSLASRRYGIPPSLGYHVLLGEVNSGDYEALKGERKNGSSYLSIENRSKKKRQTMRGGRKDSSSRSKLD